jgi:hypothetical protein
MAGILPSQGTELKLAYWSKMPASLLEGDHS